MKNVFFDTISLNEMGINSSVLIKDVIYEQLQHYGRHIVNKTIIAFISTCGSLKVSSI